MIKLHPEHCTIINLGIRLLRKGRVNPDVAQQLYDAAQEVKRGEITPSALIASAIMAARPKLPTSNMRWVARNLAATVTP